MLKTLGAALVVALTLVGLATAASQGETYKFKAKLAAAAEVPKPTGVPAGRRRDPRPDQGDRGLGGARRRRTACTPPSLQPQAIAPI
jgi:hypothetical protein